MLAPLEMSKHYTTHSFGQTLLACFVGSEVFLTKDGFLIDRHGIVLTTIFNSKEDYLQFLVEGARPNHLGQ